MNRQPLLQLLNDYNSIFPEEMEYKERMLNFVLSQEQCFERSLEIGHMTGSCWLLSQNRSEALLMYHTKLDRWLQLGGHADGHWNMLEVAQKEAQEESGIQKIEAVHPALFDIDIHFIGATSKEKAHYHYDVRFLLQVKSEEKAQKNQESKQLLWINQNPSSLPTHEPSILRMFNKWRSIL